VGTILGGSTSQERIAGAVSVGSSVDRVSSFRIVFAVAVTSRRRRSAVARSAWSLIASASNSDIISSSISSSISVVQKSGTLIILSTRLADKPGCSRNIRIHVFFCLSSIRRRSGLPGPRMCSWPTNSSSVLGRRRSASGRPTIEDEGEHRFPTLPNVLHWPSSESPFRICPPSRTSQPASAEARRCLPPAFSQPGCLAVSPAPIRTHSEKMMF